MPNNVGDFCLSYLRPKIKKLCVMHDHVDLEALFSATLEVERMLAKLSETPLEMLKEKHEKNMTIGKTMMEKQVQLLNESLINLLKM